MAGEYDGSARSARRRVLDEEDRIFEWACRRSLTEAETNARGLRRLKAKQLRLGIEQSDREAARVAKLKRKQDRVVRRLQGYIVISDSSSDDYGSDSSTWTHLLPRTPTAAPATGRAKARRGSGDSGPPLPQCLYRF